MPTAVPPALPPPPHLPMFCISKIQSAFVLIWTERTCPSRACSAPTSYEDTDPVADIYLFISFPAEFGFQIGHCCEAERNDCKHATPDNKAFMPQCMTETYYQRQCTHTSTETLLLGLPIGDSRHSATNTRTKRLCSLCRHSEGALEKPAHVSLT